MKCIKFISLISKYVIIFVYTLCVHVLKDSISTVLTVLSVYHYSEMHQLFSANKKKKKENTPPQKKNPKKKQKSIASTLLNIDII